MVIQLIQLELILWQTFFKSCLSKWDVKTFAGGRQVKSLVPLIDVYDVFKFVEERNDLNFELFNLTKDTVTVKDVAKI